MPKEEAEIRYTMKEIAEATGIKVSTLTGRRRRLGIESGNGGYTLEEVKRIIKRPPKSGHQYSKQRAALLRHKLQTDGAI